MNLQSKSVGELIAHYNTLAKKLGKPVKTSHKKSKDVLIRAINDLQNELDFGDAPATKKKAGKAKAKPVAKKKKGKGGRKAGQTGDPIRITACTELCRVACHADKNVFPKITKVAASDKNARTVGYSYKEVLERVIAKHPDCETSVASLRWYVVKIHEGAPGYEDFQVPYFRPRAKTAA